MVYIAYLHINPELRQQKLAKLLFKTLIVDIKSFNEKNIYNNIYYIKLSVAAEKAIAYSLYDISDLV